MKCVEFIFDSVDVVKLQEIKFKVDKNPKGVLFPR